MKRLLATLLLLAPVAFGQVLTNTSRGIVVAHEGTIELDGGWKTRGVRLPSSIIEGPHHVAVLDAFHNEAAIVELTTGKSTVHRTAETPIDALFAGGDLYVLCRDARVLQRFGAAGATITVAADPAFLRQANGKLYVYARTAGRIEEISGDRVVRSVTVPPYASDFEVAGTTAYLVYPREARIRTVDLRSLKPAGELAIGAVPVDLELAGGGTAITSRILAVADPSAKRVWLTEGTQSMAQAIARGFLRGLLGLGLFGSRSSQFPTGVDRIEVQGRTWVAYDSSSGSLYRFTRKDSTLLAKGISPHAFAITRNGVAWWQDGRVRHRTN